MQIFGCTLVGIFFCTNLNAQILNTEVFRSKIDGKKPVAGQVLLGFNVDKQANTIYTLLSDADVSVKVKRHSLLGAFRVRLTGANERLLLNGGFWHFRYRLIEDNPINTEYYAQYQWDGARGMQNRFVLGANLRTSLANDTLLKAYGGFGVFYETEAWNFTAARAQDVPPGVTNVQNKVLKFNTYLRSSLQFTNSTRLSLIFYYQARPETYFSLYRFAGTFDFSTRLTQHLEYRITFDGTFDNAPIVPIDNFFYSLQNRLVINF